MLDHEHAQATQRSRYRYLFTAKHHGGGGRNAAEWSPLLTEEDEFAVFDLADLHDLSDQEGRLYGVLPDQAGDLRELGTYYQQVAEFPFAAVGEPWHGYPIWPVAGPAPPSLRGERLRPARDVFDRMVETGLIRATQRKRLLKGDPA
jgi:hypothetical protein